MALSRMHSPCAGALLYYRPSLVVGSRAGIFLLSLTDTVVGLYQKRTSVLSHGEILGVLEELRAEAPSWV